VAVKWNTIMLAGSVVGVNDRSSIDDHRDIKNGSLIRGEAGGGGSLISGCQPDFGAMTKSRCCRPVSRSPIRRKNGLERRRHAGNEAFQSPDPVTPGGHTMGCRGRMLDRDPIFTSSPPFSIEHQQSHPPPLGGWLMAQPSPFRSILASKFHPFMERASFGDHLIQGIRRTPRTSAGSSPPRLIQRKEPTAAAAR
jgi:hypothetical protein